MTVVSPNPRAETNGRPVAGPEHDAEVFGQVTELFLSSVDQLSEAQIKAVDGVLSNLVGRVEAELLVELSEALSTIEKAPRQTVRGLAFHDDPQVAGPVLRRSSALAEPDLLEIVASRRQQHLLAICDRNPLGEALTDALMRFGDINVSNSLARNAAARFSECGYATLVGRAESDESLAVKLGLRLDLPGNLLRELLGKVADVVQVKFLTAPRPVAKIPGAAASVVRKKVDYTAVYKELDTLNRTGKLNDGAVNRFAVRGEYVNVVAALALKADAKTEVIELMLDAERLYGLIVACKAARLSWSTTTMIVRNRPGLPQPTQRELDQCVAIHEALLLSVAQWTIRWGSDQLLDKKEARAPAPAAAGKKAG
jgi:hypothetical protein